MAWVIKQGRMCVTAFKHTAVGQSKKIIHKDHGIKPPKRETINVLEYHRL